MKEQLTNKEIVNWLVSNDIGLSDVIDAVIDVNGIIGVGLITLAEGLSQYVQDQITPQGD